MVGIDKATEAQLNDIVNSHGTIASGFLRLLSLDAVRDRLGSKWESRADHIRFIAENTIKRHLARGQTFYQANDSGYVIVFDFDAQDRAEFVCRAIGREIVQRLLGPGENNPEDVAVELRVSTVSCEPLRRSGSPAAALEKTLGDVPPWVVSGADGAAAETPPGRAWGASASSTVAQANSNVGRSAAFYGQVRDLLAATEERLMSVSGAAGDANDSAAIMKPSGVDFLYLPFWNADARAFLSYRIESRFQIPGLGKVGIDQVADVVEDADFIRLIDRLTLSRALLDLKLSIAEGRKYITIVPVHMASMTRDSDRAAFLGLLDRQSKPIPRLVSLELIDAWGAAWHDLVRYSWSMREKCRQTILRQTLKLPWLQTQHLPDGAVGLSVMLPSTTGRESQIIRGFDAFIEIATKHRLETYIYGLRPRSLAFGAIGAGFHHVSGAAIAPRSRTPGGVALADMEDLFLIEDN